MEIALIGKGIGRGLAPKKGEGVPIWGVNDIIVSRECDICFFLDRHLIKDTPLDVSITKAVNQKNAPMYSAEMWSDIPTCMSYPFQDVMDTFGTDFFADSCCYMIALAILKGFKVISLYGFNYSHGSTYVSEKPGVTFWLGMAIGMGCSVNINGKDSELLKTVDGLTYSYHTPQNLARKNIHKGHVTPSDTSFSLGTQDRMLLIALMPTVGDYKTMEFSNRLRDELAFSDAETKAGNIHIKDVNTDHPSLSWNREQDIPPKTFTVTEAEYLVLQSIVERLNTEKKIDMFNYGLYEKFIKGV